VKQDEDNTTGTLERSIVKIRRREVELFASNPDSRLGLALAAFRTELSRAVAGDPVNVSTIERAFQFSANPPEAAA
jgi:hypothetical protein